MCKFIAERIITCQCTNENPGNSLTKRDFRLQSGNLVYKMRFSFTKRDSCVTNGTLILHFTISRRLSEEFGLKYNEKIKKWHSEWSANRRFVVELCYPRGNHIYLRWGYNYDFIPDINSKNKLTWHRTESSVKIHIADAWYNHIEDEREQDCGYTKEEFYNPRKCTSFQYQIPTYTSDIEFALEYIKNVIDKNIPLIREWINNVQTVDDAITVLNQRIVTLPHIYVPYMCHIRAFLYAKNNDIDNAIESIKQGYENSEIPQVIIDKLVQIANG